MAESATLEWFPLQLPIIAAHWIIPQADCIACRPVFVMSLNYLAFLVQPQHLEVTQRSTAGTSMTDQISELMNLIHELSAIRQRMLDLEALGLRKTGEVHPTYMQSARNLFHYLALRRQRSCADRATAGKWHGLHADQLCS